MIAEHMQGMNAHSDEPCKGGTTAQGMVIVVELGLLFRGGRGECRSLRSSFYFSVGTQGFISGFALIPPWAMQECRPKRAH